MSSPSMPTMASPNEAYRESLVPVRSEPPSTCFKDATDSLHLPRNQPPHRAMQEQDDRLGTTPNMDLQQRRYANNIIASAVQHLKPDEQLKIDGSNFADWYDDLKEHYRQAIDQPNYPSSRRPTNIISEKIARSILLHSLNPTLRRSLQRMGTCREI